jgi:outer membrane protein assembly factor BamB
MTRFPRPHGWLQWVAVAVGVLVLAVGIAAVVVLTGKPGDVSHPNEEFTAPAATTATTQPKQPTNPAQPGFEWPFYGYDKQRTRYLPLQRPIHPPYKRPWNYRAGALLEFPPVLSSRTLFLLKDDGMLVAIARKSGHVVWGRRLGFLAAASPAVGAGSVYAVILQRKRNIREGRVVALSFAGRTRWSRKLPSRAESSPLFDRGTIYFGTENGTVYALRARDGSVKWSYHADGAVKGGLAMDYRGHLYFGDYAGKVYSLHSQNGHQIWKKTTSGAHFGLSSGQFYATPAVAYGRVYLGNTDGFVYSYASSSGRLAWRVHTGGYVYGSAAVAQVPGGRPTVYVGSYDGHFYALDARSGRKIWVANAHGRVSGGAVVIGDTVWFSVLEKQTRALGARTGQLLFKINRGQFNPVVSDGERIYLVGHASLTALEPKRNQPAVKKHKKKRHAAKKAHKRKHHRKRARLRHQRHHLPRSAVVCFRSGGKTHCRHRKPYRCYKSHGHTKCHAIRRKHKR